MSLIEEALRKQREETEPAAHGSSPLKLAEPPTPPPVPEQDTPVEEAPAPRRSWAILAAIGGVCLLLLIGGLWLLFFGMKMWQTPPVAAGKAPPSVTVTRPAVAPTSTPAVAVTTPGPTNPVIAPASVNAPTGAPSGSAALPVWTAPVAVQTAAAPAGITAPIASPPKEAPLVKIGGAAPTTTLPVKPEPVKWPKLTVSGFISTARGPHGAAIVNGQMVGAGDVIDGVKVIAVDKRGVQFRFGGETQTLAVGGTTE